jgi:hypothetical protein
MRKCIICEQEKESNFFVGNVCKDCFYKLGEKICCICGRELKEDEEFREYYEEGATENHYSLQGKVCSNCIPEMVECRHCGYLAFTFETYKYFELGTGRLTGEFICRECYENYYITCNHCGGTIYTEEDQFYRDVDGFTVCEICRDYYVFCEDCERLVHIDEAIFNQDDCNFYCRSCAEDRGIFDNDDDDEIVIHDYDYKPEPIFYILPSEYLHYLNEKDETPLFLGVELEIDEGGRNHINARYIIEGGYPDFLYAKRDGSLYDGFEIVSHPATLAFHLIEAGWDKVLRRAERKGYTSHDNKRCGLHIHINRDFWGKDKVLQEIGELKLLIFFERFWNEIIKFSRRTQKQIERFCAKYQTVDIKVAKKENGENRYYAINFRNSNTIEIRIFRGTLKLLSFYATLQFVYHLCYYLRNKHTKEIQKITWKDFVNSIPEWMIELKQYLKEKGLA